MVRSPYHGSRARRLGGSILGRALLLGACVAGLGVVGGCGSDSNFGVQPTGNVRVVNAMADSRLITIEFNEALFGTISYAQATPLTRAVARDLQMDVVYVTPEGTITDALDNFGIPFGSTSEVTVVLSGEQATPTATIVAHTEFDADAGATEAQFFNAVTNGGRLEFHLVDTSQTTVSAPGTAVVGANAPGLIVAVSAG